VSFASSEGWFFSVGLVGIVYFVGSVGRLPSITVGWLFYTISTRRVHSVVATWWVSSVVTAGWMSSVGSISWLACEATW
jgi:hypothetical protein